MSVGISRCVMMQEPCLCTNSMGSSMVRIWPVRLWFIRSSMHASVVDLPQPVGPVTSTRPLFRSAKRMTDSGVFISSGSGSPKGMTRMTAP